jgi:hypothetical protein
MNEMRQSKRIRAKYLNKVPEKDRQQHTLKKWREQEEKEEETAIKARNKEHKKECCTAQWSAQM